ncbi:MAG: DEAD/DEAH box helicase family protein [Deltaproteobacteria bacterium]|nr:DEAD/DEAH box helicase family protein [Deltaproteobacteria bacterium]
MANFLRTYPVYERKFKTIWLWGDFPYRHALNPTGQDIGVDLVALTEEGEYWAIQCKCYSPESWIDKPALDSFLGASGKRFIDATGQSRAFDRRLWISTTNNWSVNAENELRNQDIPCLKISLYDLETAPVDWEKLHQGDYGLKARLPKKTLLEHQKTAVERTIEAFRTADRGKIVMCCGSGKSYTSLKIAELQTQGQGLVLFLAPSIALISQVLTEWSAEAVKPIYAICVCSDPQVSAGDKTAYSDALLTGVEDLALPATTSVPAIVKRLKYAEEKLGDRLRVIFSTYQSIDRVAAALSELNRTVELIVCDEAHRTTGVILADGDKSDFVKVHDNAFIKAKKRLYMTATPRIYHQDSKKKAAEASAILCSMDDPSLYGEEIYHLGFGEAVDRNLLSDYKVLVLTVNPDEIPASVKSLVRAGAKEIETDDVTKLIGCLNALSKNMSIDGTILNEVDPGPMKRAVAFCQTIAKSKRVGELWRLAGQRWLAEAKGVDNRQFVDLNTDHIDGSMGAATRDAKMNWLKSDYVNYLPAPECRVLCNARCLSEGIDVPTLDAVLFLSAKNSQIEVVQSVGRIMRKAPGKKFGYIIIPVCVFSQVDPNDALDENKPYEVVWTVLNALKAHDDRFQATINKLQFNEKKPDGRNPINIGSIAYSQEDIKKDATESEGLFKIMEKNDKLLHGAIYGRLVKKLGGKQDLLVWAQDVAKIAARFEERLTKVISQEGPPKKEFNEFLEGLKKSLNPFITAKEAVETLAQHLISQPVFEALFDYPFVQSNPVSKALEAMIAVLDQEGLEKDQVVLSRFYKTVKDQVAGIDTLEAKQNIIVKLYNNFFRYAAPKAVETLGIVYTPIEIVDFIIHSVAKVLKREFDLNLMDPNVAIVDPFAGCGTFLARLIQSGLLGENLDHKYRFELFAGEITLLAYYIASVNIENVYHALAKENERYQPFEGICLTDSFQLYENSKAGILDVDRLLPNSTRAQNLKKTSFKVIMSNVPFSGGQKAANDNAKNQNYPLLHRRIAETYAALSSATLKNSIYDSFVKAFRWASDRLDPQSGGVIAFVTNGSWLNSQAMDGLRKSFAKEFSQIYAFNLRGNGRTSGEARLKDAGNVFGSGSRTPIAITILVKKPGAMGPAKIYYHAIGDYLTREQKLAYIADNHDIFNPNLSWETIDPNALGDWINKGRELFSSFIVLGDKANAKNEKTFFKNNYSAGIATNRDHWCFNSSKDVLAKNMALTIGFYNERKLAYYSTRHNLSLENFIDRDSTKISWSSLLLRNFKVRDEVCYSSNNIREALYRPFFKQYLYYDKLFNERISQTPKIFPKAEYKNLVICVSGVGARKKNSAIITDILPDYNCLDAGTQCFPRYFYEPRDLKQNYLFPVSFDEYERHDAITDYIHDECKFSYGPKITKDDIFNYVYGLLHSEDYREQFDIDLKKSLPRLPLVDAKEDFMAFVKAGRELAAIHLNYETARPFAKVKIIGENLGNFKIEKMRFGRDKNNKEDKTTIFFNKDIVISGVPLEAYEYEVNGKSALAWVMERYQVTFDKDSGLTNDPNYWAMERNQPRYILDLLLRVITISLDTRKIVKNLPKIDFETLII